MPELWPRAQSRILSRKTTKSKNGNLRKKFIPWWKLVNFGMSVEGHKGRVISKFGWWEIHVTHLNIFLNFWTLRSNFSKMCKGVVFEICGVIDQVDHRESEYEVKTGTGSSFRRHFGKKPKFWVFLGPISPLLWGFGGRYLGPYLIFGD